MGVADSFINAQSGMQSLQARAFELQKAKQSLAQEEQSLALAFKQLAPPPQPAPQQPMPGQPSMLQQPPQGSMGLPGSQPMPQMSAGPPQGQMTPPPPQGAPPMSSGQPPAPMPPQQSQSPQGGVGGMGAASQPTQILRQMAADLLRDNPHSDPATLMRAMKVQIDAMRGVQPEVKDQLQAGLAEIRVQQADQRIAQTQQNLDQRVQMFDQRMRLAQSDQDRKQANDDIRNEIAGAKKELLDAELAGVDPRKIQAQKDRLEILDKTLDAKARANDPKVQRQAKLDQIKDINSQISEVYKNSPGLTPPAADQQKIKALQDKRQTIVADLTKAGMKTDEIKKALNAPAEAAPATEAAAPAPAAAPPQIPENAPTATDDKGNKVYWDGKTWVPAPKE